MRTNPTKTIGSHVSNSSLSAAVSVSIPAGGNFLMIQAFTQNIRATLDGTTPTATVGFQVDAGADPLLLPVQGGSTVKIIEETASASVQYQVWY